MNAVRSTWGALVLGAVMALQGCVSSGGPRISDEDAAQANLDVGVGYLRQGRPDLAIDNLERALEHNPRLASAHSTLALAYDQIGNTEEAEEHYARAARIDAADPNIANLYAVFLCRQDRWSEAEPYFRQAVSNPGYPTPAVALTNAGLCAQNSGDLAGAEEYLRQALARNASFPDALIGMMELAHRQANYLQARAFLQRYLDASVPTPSVLLLCFNIERELGDAGAAERCADQLREEFPQSSEVARLRQMQRDAG